MACPVLGLPNANVTELSLTGNMSDYHRPGASGHPAGKVPFYAAFTTATDEYNLGHEIYSVAVQSMLVCLDSFSEDDLHPDKAIYENPPAIQRSMPRLTI